MRSAFDFSPLFRSTVGFDRLTSLLESAARVDDATIGYPPYNIEKLDEDSYRITMAVAGFAESDLEIEARMNTLSVRGNPAGSQGDHTFLHRGIAGRAFNRTFQLADHVKVTGAHLDAGLLYIDLVREIPEEMKPRKIEVVASAPKTIEAEPKKISSGKKKAA